MGVIAYNVLCCKQLSLERESVCVLFLGVLSGVNLACNENLLLLCLLREGYLPSVWCGQWTRGIGHRLLIASFEMQFLFVPRVLSCCTCIARVHADSLFFVVLPWDLWGCNFILLVCLTQQK